MSKRRDSSWLPEISSRVTDLNEDHKLETGSMTAGVPHKGGGIYLDKFIV